MSGFEVPRFSTEADEIVEIYGECTTYVSENDIDNLRSKLSPEVFEEVSRRLGWQAEPQVFSFPGADVIVDENGIHAVDKVQNRLDSLSAKRRSGSDAA